MPPFPSRLRARAAALLIGCALAGATAAADPPGDDLSALSLDDLLHVRVVSASNVAEALSEAPATVIVLSRDDLRQRGYVELSEILDDLPGMQVVRPYGDTYLKDYWRGYRNTIGEPFLVMVDGLVMNHLYFNTADVLATLPLSNVERVEVVYGPASSVYGANAFMGVLNVITRRPPAEDGTAASARLGVGSFGRRVADVSAAFRSGRVSGTMTVRLDQGDVDLDSLEGYEYTRSLYLQDRRLWGGFVDNPNLSGFTSPHRHRAVDLRVDVGGLELGLQHVVLRSGYGVEYATDAAQINSVWSRPELSVFGRLTRDFGHHLTGRTLLRYRESDVSPDSIFLEGYPVANGSRVIDFSYWQSLNSSWTVSQDAEWTPPGRFSLNAGVEYEQKDLQKAYDNPYGPSLPPLSVNASTYAYPRPPEPVAQVPNRITTEDRAAYVQTRYRLRADHRLNVGVRYDDNSQYGSATTLRAGYVGQLGRLGLKALYGEAFQEPSPRLLYGGWTGSGSDPDLKPENSHTLEASASWTESSLSGLLSVYRVRNRQTLISTPAGAQNLGDREVIGFDVHLQARKTVPRLRQLKLWAYYSRLLKAEERLVGPQGEDQGTGRIGDLADDTVRAGVTAVPSPHVTVTALGRWVGSIRTVASNPAGRVPSYAVVDLAGTFSDVVVKGLGVAVRVGNLFDTSYAHPGIREASAGFTPGRFAGDNLWVGSGGFYTSFMPQPGRSLTASLRVDW